jgi:hypothetical protein
MEVLRQAVRSVEEKAKYWSSENRKKDEFMKTHLIGKVKTEDDKTYIREFFRQYDMHLPRPE